jgi:hypothetical protein
VRSSIFHFQLPVEAGPFALQLPEGARFLSLDAVGDRPVAYFLITMSHRTKPYRFFNACTDTSIDPSNWEYIGSVRTAWSLVFHYFKEVPQNETQTE